MNKQVFLTVLTAIPLCILGCSTGPTNTVELKQNHAHLQPSNSADTTRLAKQVEAMSELMDKETASTWGYRASNTTDQKASEEITIVKTLPCPNPEMYIEDEAADNDSPPQATRQE